MKKIVMILVALMVSGAMFAGTNAVMSAASSPAKTAMKANKKVVKKTMMKKSAKAKKVEATTNK